MHKRMSRPGLAILSVYMMTKWRSQVRGPEDTECAFRNELILWEVEFCTSGIVGNYRCDALALSTWIQFVPEGLKPSGVTYGLKSSNTKRHQGGSCAPTLTDLHVTFAVHPIAS